MATGRRRVSKDASGKGNDAKLIGKLDFVDGQIGETLEFKAAANNYVEIPALGNWETVSIECYALTTQPNVS